MDEAKGEVIVRTKPLSYYANETSAVAATIRSEVMLFDS